MYIRVAGTPPQQQQYSSVVVQYRDSTAVLGRPTLSLHVARFSWLIPLVDITRTGVLMRGMVSLHRSVQLCPCHVRAVFNRYLTPATQQPYT